MFIVNARRKTLCFRSLCLIFFFLALSIEAPAHDPGLSALDLSLEENRLVAHLTFARSDLEAAISLDTDTDGRTTTAEFNAAIPLLKAFAMDALEVRFDEKLVAPNEANVSYDESDAIHFHVNFTRQSETRLSLRSVVLAKLPPGHRQYLSLRDANGEPMAARLLDAHNALFQSSLAEPHTAQAKPPTFGEFFLLGVEHILTGYDHLVFLLALLLVGDSFGTVTKIITSFTLAHSITLTLAALDVVQMPASVIEPLIAISIVYVGLENVFHRDLQRRWLLTFTFGLVHGFGFASVLRELGISGGGAVVPLLSFNLGVEAGQAVIAAVFLPLIWKLRKHPSFVNRYVPVCSLLITLAGGGWLIERTLLK